MLRIISISSLYLVAKTILVITILSVFVFQMSFNVKMYLKRETYFLVTNDFVKSIRLPHISICPQQPWDPRQLEKYGMDDAETSYSSALRNAFVSFKRENPGVLAKEVWKNVGWNLGAVVEKFTFGDIQEEYNRTETTSKYWIRSMTPMGPCHTLRLPPMSPEDANHTLIVYPRYGPKADPCTWEDSFGNPQSYVFPYDCPLVKEFCNTSCGWEEYLYRMNEDQTYSILLTNERGPYSAPYPTVYHYHFHRSNNYLSLVAQATETKLNSKGCLDSETRHRCLINELVHKSFSELGCLPYSEELAANHTLGTICSSTGERIKALFMLADKELTHCVRSCFALDWKYTIRPYSYQRNVLKLELKLIVPYTLRKTEKYIYPFNMLLSDIGGSMGFFLGVSLFSLLEWFIVCLQRCQARKDKLAKGDSVAEWHRREVSKGSRVKFIKIAPERCDDTRLIRFERDLKEETVTYANSDKKTFVSQRQRLEEQNQHSVEDLEGISTNSYHHQIKKSGKFVRHIWNITWWVGVILLGICVATHSLISMHAFWIQPTQHTVIQSYSESSQCARNSVGQLMVRRLASRTFKCYEGPLYAEERCLQSCLLFKSIDELPGLSPFYVVDDLPVCANVTHHLPRYRYVAPQYIYEVLLQDYKQSECLDICTAYLGGNTVDAKNNSAIQNTANSTYLREQTVTDSILKYSDATTLVKNNHMEEQISCEELSVNGEDDFEYLKEITNVAKILCELGGIAGLYMGISVLTLLFVLQFAWGHFCPVRNEDTTSLNSIVTSKVPSAVLRTLIALFGMFLVLCQVYTYLYDHPVSTQNSESKRILHGYMPAVTLCHWPPLSMERLALALNLTEDLSNKEDGFLTQVKNISLILNSTLGQMSVSEFFENSVDVFWTLEEMIILYNLIGEDTSVFMPSHLDPRWTPTVTPFGRCFTFRTNGTEKGLSDFYMVLRIQSDKRHYYLTLHNPMEEPLLLGLSDTLGSYPLIKIGNDVGVEARTLPPAEYSSFEGQDRLPYSTCVSTCVHRGVRDAIGCALPHAFELGKRKRQTTSRYTDEGGSSGVDDVSPCSLAKYLEYLEALALWRSTEEQLTRHFITNWSTEDVGTSFIWTPEKAPAAMTEEEIFEKILKEQLEASPMSERRHLDACKMQCQAKRRIFITLFYRHNEVDPGFALKVPLEATMTQLEDLDSAPLATLVSDVGGVAGLTFGASVLSVAMALLARCFPSRYAYYRSGDSGLDEQ